MTRALPTAAPLFAALGDETRLRILARLSSEGPMSIARLTAEAGTDVSRQAVTKHLRTLRDAGLVEESRHGRETIWTLEPRRLDDAHRYLDRIGAQWEGALARLKAFVERE